jgi:hypothetical protein
MKNANSEIESLEEERICLSLEDEIELEEAQQSAELEKHENKINLLNEQFNKYLIEAIDETLTSLGEPVKNALYNNLECNFGIPKKDIPGKISNFSSILHKIFGLGATRLELKFMKNLNDKIQANINWPECQGPLAKWVIMDISFEGYVFKIREDFIQKNANSI